jgi:hypothetical protein
MWREKLEASAARFRQALKDPRRAQAELLTRILRGNADTEFGRQHGFADLGDLAAYRRRVPVAAYADFAARIDRMMTGEQSLLIADPPIFFARTSGTSGAPKHVGYPARVTDEYWGFVGPMLWALERDHPGSLEHALTLSGKHIEDRTGSGVPIGSASGFTRNVFRGMPFWYVAPEEVFEEVRLEVRSYALLFYALRTPLRSVTSLNPSTLLTLLKKADEFGPALADDLERGTLAGGPPGTEELVARLPPLPPPAPAAAARLRGILKTHGAFVAREMWPELSVIQTWKGGSSQLYLPAIEERLPGCVVRPLQASSTEGAFFVPLDDSWVGGVPALLSSVIEFLPASSDPVADSFVDIAELSAGEGYRIAITNTRGMYRYLVDDVFYVDGKHDGVPVLRYSHRHNLTSSLTGEKLTEADIATAMTRALAAIEQPVAIAQFQVAPRWGDPPRYVVAVELARPAGEDALRALLHRFESALADANVEYRAKRESGRLGDPELLLVRPGEFDRIKKARSSDLGRSDAQFKLPCLATKLIDADSFASISTVSWVPP